MTRFEAKILKNFGRFFLDLFTAEDLRICQSGGADGTRTRDLPRDRRTL
jgi:hypothetical protein